jgi:HEAT repeat protein
MVQWRVPEALGEIQGDPALVVPALIRLLEAPDDSVRREAAVALTKYGASAQSALPALEKRLADSKVHVQAAAVYALNVLRKSPLEKLVPEAAPETPGGGK